MRRLRPSQSRQKQTLDRDVSVRAAGSIDSAQRIAELCASGVWGFTVGTAIIDGTVDIPRTIPDLVIAVLLATAQPAVACEPLRHQRVHGAYG
jgi:hypothetical protein